MTDDEIQYACCFCKKTVDSDQSGLNPCALILIGNFDSERNDQKEQQFFCHFECFRKLVNDDGIMYIAEPEFSTIGEIAEAEAYSD
jgi:hypothetical protein